MGSGTSAAYPVDPMANTPAVVLAAYVLPSLRRTVYPTEPTRPAENPTTELMYDQVVGAADTEAVAVAAVVESWKVIEPIVVPGVTSAVADVSLMTATDPIVVPAAAVPVTVRVGAHVVHFVPTPVNVAVAGLDAQKMDGLTESVWALTAYVTGDGLPRVPEQVGVSVTVPLAVGVMVNV